MSFDAPDACTLPTADRPLRLAEFDALFATAVRAVTTLSPTHARLRLAGPPGLAATVRDLAARETACCSFFEFTLTATGGHLAMRIRTPAAQIEVLDALVERARRAAAR